MNLQHADVRRILELLDTAEHLDSLDLRIGDVVLQARKPGAAPVSVLPVEALAPTTATAAPAVPTPATAPAATVTASSSPAPSEVPDRMIAIRAPMPGTFYRTPAPTQPPFVEEGQQIDASATLCLIEVMKMFNTVPAPAAGRVHSILVEHGQAVEHEQILMIVDPTEPEAAA
ncbi:biotin carboxyl carrier protein [Rhodococcus wratislaviensis]|uniref:Biotin carboxyl carrier protein of acetyl-CoA carboxylase n=1 Tax=Rhodococcus wratislaviensis TaxID=44752 RepID=A0AB38FCL5_RHOWR|nr:biotin/lipoyl-containing protein [Rhodococcus wratislaviensis]REE75592.1 biotin carboxyl carrier protein [Rhodococcus wratislaviensis]SPZ39372.1 acetyl-CoA carboxylase biotin carboxyl carrier protein [Rhodococcus wratislaviensis]